MLKSFTTAVVLMAGTAGLASVFEQAWHRPAQITSCSFDQTTSVATINLPFHRDAIREISMDETNEGVFQGVSDDGVLVTYTQNDGSPDDCMGQKYRPELNGALQWAELMYDYAVVQPET